MELIIRIPEDPNPPLISNGGLSDRSHQLNLLCVDIVIYRIEQDENGVVQRFGQYVRTTDPGLHMKLPFGIESSKNQVTFVYKKSLGIGPKIPSSDCLFGRIPNFSRGHAHGPQYDESSRDPLHDESYMLTGDLNMAMSNGSFSIKSKIPWSLL